MFAIFAIIIAIIIFILRGLAGSPAAEPNITSITSIPYEEVTVVPRASETQSIAEPLMPTAPVAEPLMPTALVMQRKTRTKRNVSFSPRTEIREFNVNGGEIIGQYSKAIGS
jgi:hypothetical protein